MPSFSQKELKPKSRKACQHNYWDENQQYVVSSGVTDVKTSQQNVLTESKRIDFNTLDNKTSTNEKTAWTTISQYNTLLSPTNS